MRESPREKRPTRANRRKRVVASLLMLGCAVVLMAGLYGLFWRGGLEATHADRNATQGGVGRARAGYAGLAYAGSESCRECHAEAVAKWASSHHAKAERDVRLEEDMRAFHPPRNFRIGTATNSVSVDSRQRFAWKATGVDGALRDWNPSGTIGEAPLRQFLVPVESGRLQVSDAAWDPKLGEWFHVFGEDAREPGDWGHWSGRGMTWNTMCAWCHNTGLQKAYEPEADAFKTVWRERAVGCEACHGPALDHVRWRREHRDAKGVKDPTLSKMETSAMMGACGGCHSRRAEITDAFVPGDSFWDHFGLTVPDETDLYYPDGQVRDEDYEFASFLSSKMHSAGVRCWDCHDPHGANPLLPGNALCMRCHGGSTTPPAPRIDPVQHSFHKAESTGNQCINCHMPQTAYMQRHWRHDHGFTIPDPILTLNHGIPNACNRCHNDKKAEWAREAVDRWYGKRMDRASRRRAEVLASARAGDEKVLPEVVRLAEGETNAVWRTVALNMLRRWADQPGVRASMLHATKDEHPLVRLAGLRGLETSLMAGENDAVEAVRRLMVDPARTVRVDASWLLRAAPDTTTNQPAVGELVASLRHNLDQPGGCMQWGIWLMDRQGPAAALPWFERAVAWDPRSAPLRDALAVALSSLGRSAEAAAQLEVACRLAPREANFFFKLGLARSEAGNLPQAILALEQAVALDAGFSQAWYNLGLARIRAEDPNGAILALNRAELLDPRSARVPYAMATVLSNLGRREEAVAAARRALAIEPGFSAARELLDNLGRQ